MTTYPSKKKSNKSKFQKITKVINPFIAFRFLAEFTSRASTLITFPLLVKYLGTESYGVNTQANTIVGFLIPIATLGLGFGVVRIVAGNQRREDISSRLHTSLAVVGIASFFLSLIVYFLAPTLNDLLIRVEWAPEIIRWSAPLVFLTAIELTIKDYYRARLRIIAYSVFQILQTVTYVCGVTIVLINGGKLLQVIWLWLIIRIIFNIATFIYLIVIKEIFLFPSFMSKADFFDLLKFGFPIVIGGLRTWITNMGDRWVIGYFLTIDDVAVYNAAYTLAGILAALAAPFWNPLYPLMSTSLNNKDMNAVFHSTRKYTNGFTIISLPAMAGLIVLCNPLLVIFGSTDFSINPLTFTFIIFGLFLDQFSASLHYLVYLHNEPIFMRNIVLISGFANVSLNISLVPIIGISGAALATFLTYILFDLLLYKRVMSYGIKITDIYDLKNTFKYSVSSLVMAIAIYVLLPWLNPTLSSLILFTISGVLLYCLSLLVFYNFDVKKLINSI
ncbi:MAG: polysaccharide biosynthesis protein [Leptolinea sp.]|nr:polysaccharide biosynthesis protein [Leptolinea sp.]